MKIDLLALAFLAAGLTPAVSAGQAPRTATFQVEVLGKPLAVMEGWTRKLTFREVKR